MSEQATMSGTTAERMPRRRGCARPSTRLAAAMSVVLLLAACGGSGSTGGGNSTESTGGSGSTAGAGAAAQQLDGPIAYRTDDAAAVATDIGPEGGSVELSNAAGDHFVLEVPDGALLSTVTVTAVPTTEIGNTGFESAGVVFGPSGTQFLIPAELTVTPTVPVEVADQFVYTFSDDGASFGAAEPKLDTADIVIVVPHFSGYAFGTPSTPEKAAFLQREASDVATRINSRMSEILGEERDQQLAGSEGVSGNEEEIAALNQQWYDEVVRPRLAAAGSSCSAAKEAIATLLTWERHRQLLGVAEAADVSIPDLVSQAYPICEKEAIAECKAKNDPSILVRLWTSVNREMELFGLPHIAPDDPDKAKEICASGYTAEGGGDGGITTGTIADVNQPFTLHSDFDGGAGEYSYSGGMSGEVTLAGGGSGVTVEGSGTYTITDNGDGTLTLTQTTSWCIVDFGSCAPTTEVMVLTPLGG